jgi:hypothetical protein
MGAGNNIATEAVVRVRRLAAPRPFRSEALALIVARLLDPAD